MAMPKITYIEHDGAQHTVEAELGSTVMETALRNAIASIVAECGGGYTCATCLVRTWMRSGSRSSAHLPQKKKRCSTPHSR